MADKGGYELADSVRLLSGASPASAWGPTTWIEINGAWTARWPVAALHYQDGELDLLMRVNTRRPSEPSVIYRVRGDHLRRVDINGAHRGVRFTHVQGADYSGGPEITTPVPASFVGLQHNSSPVAGALYHRVLHEAAKLFGIDTAAIDWTDPPEGATS